MQIRRIQTDETDAATRALPWVEGCSIAVLDSGPRTADKIMLHVKGQREGPPFDVYIGFDEPTVMGALQNIDLGHYGAVSAATVDAHLAALESHGNIEDLDLVVHEADREPEVSFTAAGIGRVTMRIDENEDVARELRRIARNRRLDSEGHTLSSLGAMTLALAADGPEDLDRIVDTVFRGGTTRYRGVRIVKTSEGRITTAFTHDGVEMRSDGIEIPNLPETVRLAILGKQRRRLGQVVEIPGFDEMDIVGIGRNTSTPGSRGRDWVRLDVRDTDGAKFPEMEIEEARVVAHAMYRKRES